jgi:pyruvate formate lyase activating enzyme
VLPGKTVLSLASPGCNIQCKFCQNWEISQVRPEETPTFAASPSDVVDLARRHGSPTVACTYTEPVVWSEHVYDIAVATRKAGLRTLVVTNGYIQPQPMTDLIAVLALGWSAERVVNIPRGYSVPVRWIGGENPAQRRTR